jgi:hypothetical protein
MVGLGLNVAEKNYANAAIRVSPVIFFTTTKVVRINEIKMKVENPCSSSRRSEFKLMSTPPSIATALNIMGRPGGWPLYQTSPSAAFGLVALRARFCWIYFASAMYVDVSWSIRSVPPFQYPAEPTVIRRIVRVVSKMPTDNFLPSLLVEVGATVRLFCADEVSADPDLEYP